jgi:hypothetical protein
MADIDVTPCADAAVIAALHHACSASSRRLAMATSAHKRVGFAEMIRVEDYGSSGRTRIVMRKPLS